MNIVASRRNRGRLLVLSYHGIDDPGTFRAQMDELVEHRRPLSLDDVIESVRSGRRIEPASVLVTFDDGHRSVFDHGLPILSDRAIPAALFVVTSLLGSNDPFWWEEVVDLVSKGGTTTLLGGDGRELVRQMKRIPDAERVRALEELRRTATGARAATVQLGHADLREFESAGIAVGSHTMSHPCLDRCSDEAVFDELLGSRQELESALGHRVVALAYPNGNVTDSVKRLAVRAGYEVAFGFDHRLAGLPIGDPMLVSRVRVDSTTGMDRFRLLISGAHPALHRARGRS